MQKVRSGRGNVGGNRKIDADPISDDGSNKNGKVKRKIGKRVKGYYKKNL